MTREEYYLELRQIVEDLAKVDPWNRKESGSPRDCFFCGQIAGVPLFEHCVWHRAREWVEKRESVKEEEVSKKKEYYLIGPEGVESGPEVVERVPVRWKAETDNGELYFRVAVGGGPWVTLATVEPKSETFWTRNGGRYRLQNLPLHSLK